MQVFPNNIAMESVFLRFDSYDFEADRRFQQGLQTLHAGVSGKETNILDAKLFFYNRFVEPMDSISYKAWSNSASRVVPPSRGDSEGETTEKSEESQVKSLSFAEVIRLVQEGKDVPGVTKVDIQASNQSATPSQMERIRKPWEVASMPSWTGLHLEKMNRDKKSDLAENGTRLTSLLDRDSECFGPGLLR